MSIDVAAIVERARIAAADARKDGGAAGPDRERLKQIAAEFESMLLVQMLRDMRKAGSWADGEEQDTLGAESMFETIDVELATHLARVKGIGLQDQMLAAFDSRFGIRDSGFEGAVKPGFGTRDSGFDTRVATPDVRIPNPESRRTPNPESRIPVSPAPVAPTTESAPGAGISVADFTEVHESPAHSVRPVLGGVTSGFGWRRDPFTNRMKFHQGVDLRAAYGQEVQAAGAGRVVFSGDQGGYGTSVVIEHRDGTRTRYAHLSAALVAKGDEVSAGETVGRAGRSGRATGTHLHFEVIGQDGRRVAPQQWARADTTGRALPPGMDEHTTGRSGD
ncbi:MAG TPA: peptidoglycan DD-metalloendopeptidase family protein [Vicinamibacterales bacterium]